MITRRQFTTGLGLTSLSALLGSSKLAQAATLSAVRIAVDPYTTGSQMWVGKDEGFFQAQGIDAQISTFATGIEALDATLTGNADIGVGLDFPTALRMQSHQLVILASIFASKPGWHKLAVSSAITGDADLKGKSFGVASGTAQHLVTIKYLEGKGLSPSDYTLVPFSNLIEIVASLKSGRLDAGFVWADGVTQMMDTPGFTIMTDDSEAHLSQSAYVCANRSFAENNKDTVIAVLKAMNEATAVLNQDPERAAQIISKNTKAPADSVLNLLKLNTFELTLTDDKRAGFADIAEFASTVIKTPVTFDNAVDKSYLVAAVPGNVSLSE